MAFQVEHDWLIVFDNATGENDGLAQYIPQGDRGNILFTSRNLSLARYVSHHAWLEIDSMEEEDAISLLLKSSREEYSTQSRETARPIVKELCCLPLALDQAGAAIASGLCRIDDYLHRYSQHRHTLLADPTFRGASNYGHPVYGHGIYHSLQSKRWALELQMLQSYCYRLLHSCIMRISLKILSSGQLRQGSGQHLTTKWRGRCFCCHNFCRLIIMAAGSHGLQGRHLHIGVILIDQKSCNQGVYSLHPLMHCWSRDHMSHEEQKTSLHWLQQFIIIYYIPLYCQRFGISSSTDPHLKALNQYTIEVGFLLPYQDKQYTCFSLAYHEAGYWKEAEELQVAVMQMRKRILGEEHPNTLLSMGNLASTYRNQGGGRRQRSWMSKSYR